MAFHRLNHRVVRSAGARAGAVVVVLGLAFTAAAGAPASAGSVDAAIVPSAGVSAATGLSTAGSAASLSAAGLANPSAVAELLSSIPTDVPPDTQAPLKASDIDVHAALALHAESIGQPEVRDALIAALPTDRAEALRAVITAIHQPIPAPDYTDPTTRIVVLGNALNADGSMAPTLIRRLEAALAQAEEHPTVPILVTGGDTGTGFTEAAAMRDWLVDQGIHPGRVTIEDRSWTTLSNAALTHRVIPDATSLVIVTSETHLRRGMVDFTSAFGPQVTITGIASEDDPPANVTAEKILKDIYRDAINWQLTPEWALTDGLPPFFGPGVPR